MKVLLNGQEREVSDDATVASLLADLAVGPGVAVAVDRLVIPRSSHADTRLRPGAEVEVLRAVGGG